MTDSGAIRALIVDDEETARRTVRELLEGDPDIEVVGEAWGTRTPETIERLEPDLVFLDIQMPGMDGFEVLEAVAKEALPAVVFVTAYDEYALPAFEVRAVDYLVKPFTDRRFREATSRAKERLGTQDLRELRAQIEEILTSRRAAAEAGDDAWRLAETQEPPGGQRESGTDLPEIVLRDGSRTHLLRYGDIDWIEGAGTYVRIHEGDRDRLVRTTLSRLAEDLEPHGFFRIHRSSIVNLARVVELRHLSHGDYQVVLRDGTRLRLARSRREAFEETLSELTREIAVDET